MSDPLVLLGGMGCSPRLWAGVRAELGRPAVEGMLDRPDLDGCVDVLLDALPPRFALVGLSLGGIAAMALVRRAPHRVTRLALLSTNARAPVAAQYAAWTAHRAALAAGATARDLQADLLPLLLHDQDPALAEQALAMADDIGERVLDHQLAAQASRIDERPALVRVQVPTLVLAAREDRLCPPERHREIAALVPGARLQMLDGVGHLSPLEAPGRVAAALREWLVRPAARGTPPSARG
ncbi:alpha/beta fold hydrolase [Pseudonocardia saturnea]